MKFKKILFLFSLISVFALTLTSCEKVQSKTTPTDKSITTQTSQVGKTETVTIRFYNYNGELFTEQKYSKGDQIVYNTVPTRTGYQFIGWDSNGDNVVEGLGKATMTKDYKAVFSIISEQTYSITLKVDGKNYYYQVAEKNTKIDYSTYHTDPYKAPDSEYLYTFIGWDFGSGVTTTLPLTMGEKNIVGNACFEKEKLVYYTVTFKNYDEEVLYTATVAKSNSYGSINGSYKGEEPTKQSDSQYDYHFIGWSTIKDSPAIDDAYTTGKATSNWTLYAVYSKTQIVHEHDDSDGVYTMITNDYFDTSKSWTRTNIISYQDPDTTIYTRSAIEEEYNAELKQYYRKALLDITPNYDEDTYLGGTVVMEVVFDESGVYNLINKTFAPYTSGKTFETEVLKVLQSKNSINMFNDNCNQNYVKEKLETYVILDNEGLTEHFDKDEIKGACLSTTYQGFSYNGTFYTESDVKENIVFLLSIIKGNRGSDMIDCLMSFKNVNNLVTKYASDIVK